MAAAQKNDTFFLKFRRTHATPSSPEVHGLAPLTARPALPAGRAAAAAYEEQGPQIRGKSASDN